METNNSRRNFIKKACSAGACFCGFGSLLSGKENRPADSLDLRQENLYQTWITEVLENLDTQVDKETAKNIIRTASKAHYEQLNMDILLIPYVGKLKKFINFIEKEWDWKINYDEKSQILVADENKPVCVCPLVSAKREKYPALCFCSEGFAELMFSKICEAPVEVKVISSIHRGDDKCIYHIKLDNKQ